MIKYILFVLLFTLNGYCQRSLPSNLSQSERKLFLSKFGTQTTAKLLTNPYPLGGYDGFEIGLSLEEINFSNFTTPGLKKNRIQYPSFSIAKGLFNNVDVHLSFVPPLRQSTVSNYGVLIKWAFNEGMFLPVVWSASVHTSSTNADDQFSSKASGVELSGGYAINNFSVYAGAGLVNTTARFLGIKEGVNFTSSGADEFESETSKHLFFGVHYQISSYFAALQIDQYNDLIATSKIGLRF